PGLLDTLCGRGSAQPCRGNVSAATDEICLEIRWQTERRDGLNGRRLDLQSAVGAGAQQRGQAIARESNRLLNLSELLPCSCGVRVGLIDCTLVLEPLSETLTSELEHLLADSYRIG